MPVFSASDALVKGFQSPPDSAKPHVWWHWMNGNISRDGIAADLEAMARVGIGGATIFNVDQTGLHNRGIPPGEVAFNSSQWREMVKYAAQEASRLGLELGIHNCGGWSSSGGPWNKPENGMQTVVTKEHRVHGPYIYDELLEQPFTKTGPYRDIAVIAYRTPQCAGMGMKEAAPEVTTSVTGADGRKLTDGNDGTSIIFPEPKPSATAFIQFRFNRPYTARQLVLRTGKELKIWSARGRIEVSDDGVSFRNIATVSLARTTDSQTYIFPETSALYYRVVFTGLDIWSRQLEIAEVGLSPELAIGNLTGKAFFNFGGDYQPGNNPIFRTGEVISQEQIVDLTSHLKTDGRLHWEVPDGDWTILRVGYAPNGQTNRNAPKEGTGLECDKLSAEAVDAHWEGLMQGLIRDLGPLVGKTLKNVLIDSYEIGSQNWTPKFPEEFQKRRGYDLLPFLPTLHGMVVGSPEMTERFLWDFRRTIADLFAENYSGRFALLAHCNGLQFSLEPYGLCPTDNLQYGSHADIPMTEFWIGRADSPLPGKNAASIAHVYGRKFVGAEAFTTLPEDGRWQQDPFSFKRPGDFAWCVGVNRLTLHCYALQPWTQPTRYPGMTMDYWGSQFGRTTTWWEQSKEWFKYLARSQFLLQQGQFVADVCSFSGDGAPNDLKGVQLPSGYDYDGCSADALMLMEVKDGCIVLPGGMSYRLLALPPDDSMTLSTLRKINELANKGAVIVGRKPTRSPGLTGYPRCDDEVRKLAAGTSIITDKSPAQVLSEMNIQPDFRYPENRGSNLAFIHRREGDTDIYFVSNQLEQFDEVECTFRIDGKVPELWHPDTGKIEQAPVWKVENGHTTVMLPLDPAGSIFVVFRGNSPASDHFVEAKCTMAKESVESSAKLVIRHAVYESTDRCKSVDVTSLLTELVRDGSLEIAAVSNVLGQDPSPGIVKQLRVEYDLAGEVHEMIVPEKAFLTIGKPTRANGASMSKLEVEGDNVPEFRTFLTGSIELKTASGKKFKAEVCTVASPLDISESWELNFPPNWGAPAQVELSQLIPWTECAENGVKYFSGTATYVKDVDIPDEMFGSGNAIWLDLGLVKNLAEVSVNGKSLGILWKPPFRMEITAASKPGNNRIEIKVTNLWPNRMIGDEQLPPDCEWKANNVLKEWPQWLLEGKPSPTGRLTFATYHHWKKNDKLLPAGLLGPVKIRSEVKVLVRGDIP